MGRSFQSVRQGVNSIAGRWERSSQCSGCRKRMVELAKRYSSEGFMGCNDPLEAVIFSAVVEVLKNQDKAGPHAGNQVDPWFCKRERLGENSGQMTE